MSRQARHVGPVARGLGAGLVRRRGAVLLRPAVLRPELFPAGGQQLRVLQRPRRHGADRPGRQSATAESAAAILGQADQEIMQDAAVYPITTQLQPLPRQLRPQRGVRAGHPAVRPDERLAEHARQLTGRSVMWDRVRWGYPVARIGGGRGLESRKCRSVMGGRDSALARAVAVHV